MDDLCGADTPDGPCALPVHRRGWHDANPPRVVVPRNRDGHVQVSISQLRRYGAVDLLGEDSEGVRGCPRAYALTYSGPSVPEIPNPAAELGSVLHRALHRMETHTCGPEDALGAVWPATLGMDDYATAQEILLGYLEREGPMTRYATLDTELDLSVLLYVDDEFGPVYFRGIVDNLSVDPTEPDIVHLIDHKSSARPVSVDSLRGDVQLRGYDWLVRRWWTDQHGQPPARVVAHLDLLRYRDIAIEYTPYELDIWHGWACAMVRTMLRDRAAMPILNPGCSMCAVRWGCPAWKSLPGEGASMLARMAGRAVGELKELYGDAAEVAALLGKQLTDLKAVLEAETHAVGALRVGDQDWVSEPGSKTVADVLAMVGLLLPDHPAAFTTAVGSSKAAAERACRGLNPSLRDEVLACVDTVPAGRKVTKKKVSRDETG
jgi:PD-(D/E)XK nuclease superfamily